MDFQIFLLPFELAQSSIFHLLLFTQLSYTDITKRMFDSREPERLVNMYAHHAEERLGPENDVLARVLSHSKVAIEEFAEPWRRFFELQKPDVGHESVSVSYK